MEEMSFSGITLKEFPEINMRVKLVRNARPKPPTQENELYPHSHSVCEVYFHISGNICFMVENNIYPVKTGDLIISRPFEYHHCIYINDAPHDHICLFISASKDNSLFYRFFDRPVGTDNLIQLHGRNISRFKYICERLASNEAEAAEAYSIFFELLSLINTGSHPDALPDDGLAYPDIKKALDYITQHMPHKVKISDIAEAVHVSVNTLERHFINVLGISPSQYISEKRFIIAQDMLINGTSVQETSECCGFPSCSYFIKLFKSRYGMTPYEYKQRKTFSSGAENK